MKSVIKYIFRLIFPTLCLLAGFWLGCNYGKSRIPHLRDFQKRIGCKKIDNKVGPMWYESEVQRCWGNAYLKQKGIIMY
jgi:hypothetical protein